MDIQRKAFEESNNVNPDWSFKFDEELQQYVAVDFEMTNQVDEFNEHWDTFRAGWDAKAQAVPEGFVLVPKKPDVDKAWNIALKRIVPPPKINDVVQKELMCKKYVDDLCFEQDRILLNYEEMIEAQEQSHENG